MAIPPTHSDSLAQELQNLQQELAELRKKNQDLNERLTAYSFINNNQTILINNLIDKVPFGIFLLNEENIIIHANAAAGKIFDQKSEEMQGKNCNNYFSCFDEKGNCPALASNEDISFRQVSCVNDDMCVMHSAFVSDEGSEKIIVESFMDVTEIKQAEKTLLKLNNIKDEFLGMISHELRSPLNVIQGYSSLLDAELNLSENDNVALYISKIQKSGEMLLQIVDNLLSLSSLTAGKVKADNIPIEFGMVVTQLTYRIEDMLIANNNTFITEVEDIPPFVLDLALLMKILYELLVNANKFTKNGNIILSAFIQKKDDADWLVFKVADTGCGMTEETVNQVFQVFHQADSSITRSYEGLGLGLSIVEKMVSLINGYVEVESELTEGTTFYVYVPFVAV